MLGRHAFNRMLLATALALAPALYAVVGRAETCVHVNNMVHEDHIELMANVAKPVPSKYDSRKAGGIRQQCQLGSCWLDASQVENEFRIVANGHDAVALSIDYTFNRILRDWFPAVIADASSPASGLDTGGDEFTYDALLAKYGAMPSYAFDQVPRTTWQRVQREVSAQVEVFRASYAGATNAAQRKAVLAQAGAWLDAYLAQNVGAVPDTFLYEGKQTTARDFVKKTGLTSGKSVSYVDNAHNQQVYSAAYNQPYIEASRGQLLEIIAQERAKGRVVRGAVNWAFQRIQELNKEHPGIVNLQTGGGTRDNDPHEVVFAGLDYNKAGDVVGVVVQNSWGKSNGDHGYYYFDLTEFWDVFRVLTVHVD